MSGTKRADIDHLYNIINLNFKYVLKIPKANIVP